MGRPKGSKTEYFRTVKEAREALQDRAKELLDRYLQVVMEAHAAGNHELAIKSLQYLMERMPSDDGLTMLDGSVDRQKVIEAPKQAGPSIKIGIALGGVGQPQKQLPSVTVVEDDIDGDS